MDLNPWETGWAHIHLEMLHQMLPFLYAKFTFNFLVLLKIMKIGFMHLIWDEILLCSLLFL